ncbi:MAG: acyl-CoA thioesterase [Alphaproteobacteria bacterium]
MPLAVTKIVELVVPKQANHHGTLYGGTALALMDKTAFLTGSRYARRNFVTASAAQIDFLAPARQGQLVELAGSIERVGNTSLAAGVELYAEDLIAGTRKLCARGSFVLVAVDGKEPIRAAPGDDRPLPPHAAHMMEMIFPDSTDHHGELDHGAALGLMGKAAFVAASRFCRQSMIMIASGEIDFHLPSYQGELIDLVAHPTAVSGSDVTVSVAMTAENFLTGARRLCARGTFTMRARDAEGNPALIGKTL